MKELKVYTINEVQELKKKHFNFGLVAFKDENKSEYKMYYRNKYLENVIIDFGREE